MYEFGEFYTKKLSAISPKVFYVSLIFYEFVKVTILRY